MKMINSKMNSYLRQYPINDYFSFDIKPFLSLVEFYPSEYIFRDDSSVKKLYYLIDGKAKLALIQSNGKAFINIIKAPSFIGEIELLNAQEYANEVCAYSSCICYAISLSYCKEQILSDARFLRYLCSYLCRDSIGNVINYTQNQAYPLENRLAKFILLMSHNNLYTERHTEASRYLGVSYRHLLYVIATFCKDNILSKDSRGYQIINLQKLKELSKEIL